MSKARRSVVVWIVIAAIGLFVAFRILDSGPEPHDPEPEPVPVAARRGPRSRARRCSTRTTRSTGRSRNGTDYEVKFPDGYTDTITKQIVNAKVRNFDVDSQKESPWVGILLNLLPVRR